MTRSYKPAKIDKRGKPPAKAGGVPPNLDRCPIIGDPLKWLERSNEELKGKEK